MKKVGVFPKLVQKKQQASSPKVFVFCDKATGATHFRGTSVDDQQCTMERISGLLAMQCLVRGQDPRDFEVMVPAEGFFVDQLVARAQELLEAARTVAGPATLSARQREVLHSVMENRANKEIASKLNITVRTVKFHISALLSKFGVDSRAELARRAAGFMRPMILEEMTPAIERRGLKVQQEGFEPMRVETTLQIANKAKNVRFPGGVLTA